MPALDRHHEAVRNALTKDGWTITADPLTLQVAEDRVLIDLGAFSPPRKGRAKSPWR